ncbi:MAG: TlpA disulfide reductase family protein [Candidatus Omnitrophota bacterium]
MKRTILGRVFVAAAALFLLGACAMSNAVEIGDSAPDFTLQDMNGKTASLSGFKGNVVILDFFASWCPPCRQEIPDFIELQKAYGGKGFAMVGVSLVRPQESKDFAGQAGINYPVLIDDGKASAAYGPIRSIPTTFLISREFKIAKIYIGYRPKDVFEKDIKELLE